MSIANILAPLSTPLPITIESMVLSSCPKRKRADLNAQIANLIGERAMSNSAGINISDFQSYPTHVRFNEADAAIAETRALRLAAQQQMIETAARPLMPMFLPSWPFMGDQQIPAAQPQLDHIIQNQHSQPARINAPHNIILQDTEFCKYAYDSDRCIVQLEILQTPVEGSADWRSIMRLMEVDDDIALIMNNLSTEGIISVDKLLLNEDRGHIHFKIFRKQEGVNDEYIEDKEGVEINIPDYLEYLKKYEEVTKADGDGGCLVESVSHW